MIWFPGFCWETGYCRMALWLVKIKTNRWFCGILFVGNSSVGTSSRLISKPNAKNMRSELCMLHQSSSSYRKGPSLLGCKSVFCPTYRQWFMHDRIYRTCVLTFCRIYVLTLHLTYMFNKNIWYFIKRCNLAFCPCFLFRYFWRFSWHSLWHSTWQFTWHSTMYSDILSGIPADVFSGIRSEVSRSEVFFGILSSIWPGILSDIHLFMTVCLTYVLTFYLAFRLTYGLTLYRSFYSTLYFVLYLACQIHLVYALTPHLTYILRQRNFHLPSGTCLQYSFI